MPINPADFEVVHDDNSKWAEFEAVPDPKALATGVGESLDLTNRVLSTLTAGAIPSAMGQAQGKRIRAEQLQSLAQRAGAMAGGGNVSPSGVPLADEDLSGVNAALSQGPFSLVPQEAPGPKGGGPLGGVLGMRQEVPGALPSGDIAANIGLPKPPGLYDSTVQGVGESLLGTADFMLSPIGISTLGIGGFARPVQRLIALGFAGQMAHQAPEIARELGTEFGKNPEDRDNSKIAKLITDAATTTGFTVAGGLHGLAPGADIPAPGLQRLVDRSVQGPTATGDQLSRPNGAPAPRLEPPPGLDLNSPEEAAAQAEAMNRNATASFGPRGNPQPQVPRLAKPEVPEGPSDPRVTEIQQQGLGTINEILQEYPALKGNRSAARELRNLAFPELKGKPDNASPVRTDQGLPNKEGPETGNGEEDSSGNVEQTPPRGPQPVEPGGEAQAHVQDEAASDVGHGSLEHVASLSGGEFFDVAQQWSKAAMEGKGAGPQVRAERAAQDNPDLAQWEAEKAKVDADKAELMAKLKKDPSKMGELQNELMGIGQKGQFINEGIKILKGQAPETRFTGETAPVSISPASDEVAKSDKATPSPDEEYDASLADFRKAAQKFTKAREDHHAGRISDDEFIKASDELKKAQAVSDAAERKFIEARNKAVEPKVDKSPNADLSTLIDVPETARTPEARRARIVKLLEQFEQEDPVTGQVRLADDLTEAQEKAAKRLRSMLGEIEKAKLGRQEPKAEATAPEPITPKEKAPWEVTKAEWFANKLVQEGARRYPGESLESVHKRWILKAQKEGRTIPPEVLADYPDLAKPATKPSVSEPPLPSIAEQHSIKRVLQAAEIIRGPVKKAAYERAMQSLRMHAGRLGIDVDKLSTYFGADEYRKIAGEVSIAIAKKYGSHPTEELRARRDAVGPSTRKKVEATPPVSTTPAAGETPAQTMQRVGEHMDQRRAAYKEATDKLPDGIRIGGWQKGTYKEGIVWTKNNKGTKSILDDAGQKAVDAVLTARGVKVPDISPVPPEPNEAAPVPPAPVKAAAKPATPANIPELLKEYDRLKPLHDARQAQLDQLGKLNAAEMPAKEANAHYEKKIALMAEVKELDKRLREIHDQTINYRLHQQFSPYYGKPQARARPAAITTKNLKAQKSFLMGAVDDALKAAPETGKGDAKVTFSVPGDGEWKIFNDKESLKKFKEIADKFFPETVTEPGNVGIGGSPMPGLPSAKAKPMPKAIEPKAAKNKTLQQAYTELIGDTVSTDPNREAINVGYADGQQIVSTDGRQLLRIVTDKAPGTVGAPVRLNAKGKVVEGEHNYPNFNAVIEDHPDLMLGGAKSDELWSITNQARALFKGLDSEKTPPAVRLFANPDGSLGGKAEAPGVGSYEHNIKPGAKDLGQYNADYLFNAADVARRLGNEKVDLYGHGAEGAIDVRGKDSQHLVMPLKTKGTTEAIRATTFPPSQKVHGSLPKGLPPFENPESFRFKDIKEGGGNAYRVSLEGGQFKIEKETRPYAGAKTVEWKEIGKMNRAEWADHANGLVKRSSALTKFLTEGDTKPSKALILKADEALSDLGRERERVVEQGKAREQAAAAQGVGEKIVSALEAKADKARARLKAKESDGPTFGSGPLHELPNIRDYAIIGAAKLARYGLDKARFAAEMVDEFGKRISKHIDRLFEESKVLLARHQEIERNKATPIQQIIGEATGAASAKPSTVGQIIDTLQTGLKTVRALKDHFTDAPQVSRAEVKIADDFLEADANRIRESLGEYVKANLPVAERGRFLTAIGNATRRSPLLTGDPEAMYRRAATVAARIEDRATEVKRNDAVNAIKDNVAKALDSPTVDLRFKSAIGDLVKNFTFTRPTEATIAKLRSIREYIASQEALGRDVEMPKAILESLEILNKTPIKDLPVHVLEAMRDRIALLEEMGRRTVATRQLRWENEKAAKNRELANEPTNPLDKRPQFTRGLVEGPDMAQKIGNFIRRQLDNGGLIDKALLPIDALFDLLGDAKGAYKGWLFKNVRNPLDLGFNAAVVMRDRITKPLVDLIKQHNLDDKNARRIGVYAALQQEGGRDRMLSMGATPEELAQLERSLSPAERAAYKVMRTALDQLLPQVQKLMHELYNIPVEPVENYFPMPRDWSKVEVDPEAPAEPKFGEERSFDDLVGWRDMAGDYSPRTTRTEQGMTIERLKGAESAIKIHAFDVFEQNVNDVAHLLSTQRDIKQIGELAKGDLFIEKYGKLGQSMVLNWLDTVARQGKLGGFRRWNMLDVLRKNTSAGVIGFRLASQFVHLSNVPLAMERTGVNNYRSGLVAALTEKGQQFLKDNFAETYARGGGEPALVEAMNEGSSVFGKQIVPKRFVKAGFAIAREIDQKNSQATVLGMYFRALKEKGIDPSQYADLPVDKEAQARALVMARRAVASPLPKDVPMALSRGALSGGNLSVGRAMFQFQNIFLDQWSNIRHDLWRAGIREALLKNGDPIKAIRTAAALTAMIIAETGIREASKQAIQSATGNKPKHEMPTEGKVAIETLRRFPFMGQATAAVLHNGSGVPLLDSVLDVPRAAYSAITAKGMKGQDRAKIRAISGAAQLMGVPGASQLGEIAEKSL